MSRRVSGVLLCAVALSLSLSACSGGDPSAAEGRRPAASTSTSTAPSYGEPGVASVDEAFAALRDYNRRNNEVIRAVQEPPHTFAAWSTVDAGPTLAADAFATKAAARGVRMPDRRWVFERPVRVYAPPATTWPKEMLVAARAHPLKGRAEEDGSSQKYVGLGLFSQAADGAAWKHVASAGALASRLPEAMPAGVDAVTSQADRDRAVEAARQLPDYWRTGAAPAGFAGTRFIDQPRTWRAEQLKRGIHRDISYAIRLFDGPGSVHAFRAKGGLVVLASYRSEVTLTAVDTLKWTEPSARAVWGAGSRPVLRRTEVIGASFFLPDSGKAQPLGYSRSDALF